MARQDITWQGQASQAKAMQSRQGKAWQDKASHG
jgi:hypothetical protein